LHPVHGSNPSDCVKLVASGKSGQGASPSQQPELHVAAAQKTRVIHLCVLVRNLHLYLRFVTGAPLGIACLSRRCIIFASYADHVRFKPETRDALEEGEG
jgi:hypothetical protein